MIRKMIIALSLAWVACADDVPGVSPPADQLHFPLGLAIAPGATADADLTLFVSNSNFDQRFNAASITALSVDGLIALIPPSGSEDVAFNDVFGAVIKSRVRVHQFGGDLVYVQDSANPENGRVYMASRGKNRLIMVRYQGGQLNCSTPGVAPILALDCTDAFVVRTQFADPFAVAYSPDGSPEGVIAVGHLRAEQTTTMQLITTIALISPASFTKRIEEEMMGGAFTKEVEPIRLFDVGGVTGLSFARNATSVPPSLLVAGRAGAPDVGVTFTSLELGTDENDSFTLSELDTLYIGAIASTVETRSLAVSADGKRAYASSRFVGIGGVFSSGIAVIALDEPQLRLISIFEIGDELGRPFILDRKFGMRDSRLLYVPDVRNDRIFILDASADSLRIAGAVEGRRERQIAADKKVLAHILDAPATIVFVERGGRTLGFVSNFANSTLGVIDASDVDPTRHRVVARLGRDIDPNGMSEEEL